MIIKGKVITAKEYEKKDKTIGVKYGIKIDDDIFRVFGNAPKLAEDTIVTVELTANQDGSISLRQIKKA